MHEDNFMLQHNHDIDRPSSKYYHQGHSHKHSHKHFLSGSEHVHGPQHFKHYDRKKAIRTIITCIVLVFVFMLIELIGGIISRSLALVADSIHMFTDFISLILALTGMIIAQRKNNTFKTYGYSRFEVIMSLINSIFLLFVCFYIVVEAIKRMSDPQEINLTIMLPVAISGLLLNFLTMYLFYRNGKSEKKKGNNKNLLMHSAFLHFLTDALGSIMAISSGIIIYYTGWNIADAILSIVLVILILRSTFSVIKDSIYILMESSPRDINNVKIERALEKNIEGLIDVHHIHLWMLNEQENIITLHAVIKKGVSVNDTVMKIKQYLEENYNIVHSTIQVEEENMPCFDCKY